MLTVLSLEMPLEMLWMYHLEKELYSRCCDWNESLKIWKKRRMMLMDDARPPGLQRIDAVGFS